MRCFCTMSVIFCAFLRYLVDETVSMRYKLHTIVMRSIRKSIFSCRQQWMSELTKLCLRTAKLTVMKVTIFNLAGILLICFSRINLSHFQKIEDGNNLWRKPSDKTYFNSRLFSTTMRFLSFLDEISIIANYRPFSDELQPQRKDDVSHDQPPQDAYRLGPGNMYLSDHSECSHDISKYCMRHDIDMKNDMMIIICLQEVGISDKQMVSDTCQHLIWQYKVNLTDDDRVKFAVEHYCRDELTTAAYGKDMQKCSNIVRPGFALSCYLDFVTILPRNSLCFGFLTGMSRLAFHDYPIVAPFVDACREAIKKLNCGKLLFPSHLYNSRLSHSQGSTVKCIIEKLTESLNNQVNELQNIDDSCQHQIMRIAELQYEDYHLDIPLFLACREDREKFCGKVFSGKGEVFECLLSHRNEDRMDPKCSSLLGKRAAWVGKNFRLANRLVDGCDAELRTFNCGTKTTFASSPNFHLTRVLLCLENAEHRNGSNFSESCRHEMFSYRQLLMTQFRLSPEVVMNCAQEIDAFCTPNGDIETEGKTLHCLMARAQERNEKDRIGHQCMNALTTLVKVADIPANYYVDPVLYASCKPLIEGQCAMDAHSHSSTLSCLMKHIDANIPKECENRLLEVQYFISRDWYTPELSNCREDAVRSCSAEPDWHTFENFKNRPETGPFVLSCLYRLAYFNEISISKTCALSVRKILHERAVRVRLIPAIEDACRFALSEYCSNNIKPSEEMKCLQEHFEEKNFIDKYGPCYRELREFTKMEAKDTALNAALSRACRPVIMKYCSDFEDEDMDHGDVLNCLADHKMYPEMNRKCLTYVNHFELVSHRNYEYSYRFSSACATDIKTYCDDVGNNIADVIRCLSNVLFESMILGGAGLKPACKKEFKKQYLTQEKFRKFDNSSHMKDADPHLMSACKEEIEELNCFNAELFENVIECLRENHNDLNSKCKAAVFGREKIEAVDNTLDDELQTKCSVDISKFCKNYEGENIIDCLKNSKIRGKLGSRCLKVVIARLREKARDIRLNIGLFVSCKEEAKLYCHEDYEKILDRQYAETSMEGVLVACLRTQFIDASKRMLFSGDCKDEISKLILESELDMQTDPTLYRACKNVIPRHCSDSVLSFGGIYDVVLECLKNEFSKGLIKDVHCSHQIARHLEESLVDIHLDPALHEMCANDVQRLCSDIPPGESRIIICLIDSLKKSSDPLTSSCKNLLTERNELWRKAHQEFNVTLPQTFAEIVEIVSKHPHRTSLLTWLSALTFLLFVFGCLCGRVTKRVRRDIKDR